MKIIIMTAVMLGMTGGVYANEALKALAAQAPAEAVSVSAAAPSHAAVTAEEADKQAYDTMAGLFKSGQDVQLSELVSPDYPNGYAVQLITADEHGALKRGGGSITITSHYDLAGPTVYFSAACTLMGLGYKGSDYNDTTTALTLRQVISGNGINIEIKRNGDRIIFKAANLPEGTGYGLLVTE